VLFNAKKFKVVRNWLVGYTPSTLQCYTRYFREFCEFSQLDPDQLISLAETDKRSVRAKLAEFHQDYARRGYSSNTSHNAYMAIRSFFCHNEIRFGRFPPGLRGETQYESTRIFSRSEIFGLLVGARTPRDKAIISFLVQSGQRVGVITKLLYGAVREQIEKSICPVVIDVGANISKNRVHHSFAIGKECVDFIRIMIDERRAKGEPIDDSSWLFRSFSLGWSKASGKWIPGGRAKRQDRGQPLEPQSISPILRNAAVSGGVPLAKLVLVPKIPSWNRFELHPHAFRRWWKNAMRKGGVRDPAVLDYMMGHHVRYNGAYDGFDPEYLRKEYSKAEPQLTLLNDHSNLSRDPALPNPQRVVHEHELEALFAEGWRFVTTLPSGRIVVQVGS
jgi:integrase